MNHREEGGKVNGGECQSVGLSSRSHTQKRDK